MVGRAHRERLVSLMYYTICSWLKSQVQKHKHRGLTVKSYVDFPICVYVCVCIEGEVGVSALYLCVVQGSTLNSKPGILDFDIDLPRHLGQLI